MPDEKPISADKFAAVCELLWGPSWRGTAARELKVNERTIGRWSNDEFNIPPGVRADLAKLCRRHAEKLVKMAERLEA